MLISVDTGEIIDYIPHKKEYDIWRSRLKEGEYQEIVDKLNSMIDSDEIHTAGWMPGSDWTGTVFQPIYEKACNMNFEQAALFFGLIVWTVFMNREDKWSFGRYEKNSIPIRSLTYFRVHR